MPVISSNERSELSTLHAVSSGTGSNIPDNASRTSNGNSVWTQPRTLIPTPGADRQTRPSYTKKSSTANPYSSIKNNLPNSRGNPSASRTLVPTESRNFSNNFAPSTSSDRLPPSKKARTDPEGTMTTRGKRRTLGFISPSKDDERNLRRKEPTRKPAPIPWIPDNVINVDDESGEDLGEPIPPLSESSDDIRLHDGEHPGDDQIDSIQAVLGVNHGPSKEHPFNNRVKQPAFLPPPAGPKTSALKAKIDATPDNQTSVNSDEFDPIDQFNERHNSPEAIHRKRKATPSRQTDFTVGNVRDKTKQYEHNNLPEIDLFAKVHVKANSKVRSMKPRKSQMVEGLSDPGTDKAYSMGKPPPCTRRAKHDAIATSPTNFEFKGKPCESDEEFLLPIETWICGAMSQSYSWDDLKPRHWLCMQKNHILIVKHPVDTRKRKSEFKLKLKEDVPGVTFPRNFDESPCLAFSVQKTQTSADRFDGDSGIMEIHVKILKNHSNGIKETYERMKKAIQSNDVSSSHMDAAAIRAVWGRLQQQVASADTAPTSSISQTASRPKPRPAYLGFRDLNPSEGLPERNSPPYAPSLRRSSRNSTNPSRNPDRPPSPAADETILLYPFTGTGAVNVTHGDLKRLEPGEYLNDSLIELGLKLWLNDVKGSRPEFAEQVHVFSSFFYTQLNHKNVEEGYQSVRKWTSKFDLFKKKYIIVPINEHMHWYLAIICYPDRALNQPTSLQPVTPNVITRKQHRESATKPESHMEPISQEYSALSHRANSKPISSSSKAAAVDEQEVEKIVSASPRPPLHDARTPPPSPLTTLAPDSPRGEIIPETESEGEDERKPTGVSIKVDSTSPQSASRAPGAIPSSTFYADPDVKMRSVSPEKVHDEEADEIDGYSGMDVDPPAPVVEPAKPDQRPYIFSFDSLGARHPHALKLLSRYLDLESKDKKGLTQSTSAIMKQASVPTQPNYCDCGVYLLHFVEQFMSDPDTFTRHIADHTAKKSGEVNRQEKEHIWNHAVVASKRDTLKQSILSLSSEWKREKEAEGKDKGKGKEKKPSSVQTESIEIDDDSEIEVLEVTPEPGKGAKSTHSRTPAAHKAHRLR